MPLVHADEPEQPALDTAHEQARKIQPRFARGELRRVTVASNLAEAELIKGVLLEQGIPSLIRRTAGFDVPDFLAAGPRDVLVPEAGFEAAQALLAEVDAEHAAASPGLAAVAAGSPPDDEPMPPRRPAELRIGAAVLALLLAFGAVAGVLFALLR
jgi:hypothetical protein